MVSMKFCILKITVKPVSKIQGKKGHSYNLPYLENVIKCIHLIGWTSAFTKSRPQMCIKN